MFVGLVNDGHEHIMSVHALTLGVTTENLNLSIWEYGRVPDCDGRSVNLVRWILGIIRTKREFRSFGTHTVSRDEKWILSDPRLHLREDGLDCLCFAGATGKACNGFDFSNVEVFMGVFEGC